MIIPTPFVLSTAISSLSELLKLPPPFTMVTLPTPAPFNSARNSVSPDIIFFFLLYTTKLGGVRYLDPTEVIPTLVTLKLSFKLII